MLLNADFSRRVVMTPQGAEWLESPMAGVSRRMLDRVGAEVARATSVVRYAAGSHFDEHVHARGEEFLVLDGVFSDAQGDYPAGTYVRNPPGSRHAPWSDRGCTLFVKLRQFAADDIEHTVIDTATARFVRGGAPGLEVLPLHSHGTERVTLVRAAPGARVITEPSRGGQEIYVLEGLLEDEGASYPAGSWIRSPDLAVHDAHTEAGCLIYLKTGHLLGRVT